jgi:hypothetical protein
MNDPERVDAETQALARDFNRDREALFRGQHEQLRVDLERVPLENRPRTVGALIRHYRTNEAFLYEVVNPIYQRAIGLPLPRENLRELLGSIPLWRMFLIGYAYAIFQRAILGNRDRRNPGNLDLWSAVYLPCCDVFVTNDLRQRKALKVLNLQSRPIYQSSLLSGMERATAPVRATSVGKISHVEY